MSFFSGRKNKQNEEIIEQIILENYNQYYRLAYSYVHNEADANDIVQNGAYKALRGANTLQQLEYAKTWVYRIMLNEIFRYVKQIKDISYEALQEEQQKETEYTEDSYKDIDLERALEELPEKDKAIIVLRFFEDKTLEEIAEILEENISTIKSRLYRSMKKLKILLSDE